MTSFGDDRPSTLVAREAEQARQAQAAQAARLCFEAQLRAEEQARAMEDMGPPPPPPNDYPSDEELAGIREKARLMGYDDGHAHGHADALAAGKLEAAEQLEHLRALTESFGTALHDADQLIAADVLELALHLAKGMLKTALPVKPELILPMVREVLGEELDKGGWRVIEDAAVGRGGCKVDTASNQIDAQAASRWQRLTHALGKDLDRLA